MSCATCVWHATSASSVRRMRTTTVPRIRSPTCTRIVTPSRLRTLLSSPAFESGRAGSVVTWSWRCGDRVRASPSHLCTDSQALASLAKVGFLDLWSCAYHLRYEPLSDCGSSSAMCLEQRHVRMWMPCVFRTQMYRSHPLPFLFDSLAPLESGPTLAPVTHPRL